MRYCVRLTSGALQKDSEAVAVGWQRRGDPDSIPGEELRPYGSSSPGSPLLCWSKGR